MADLFDIDFNFNLNENGDLILLEGQDVIKNSVKNVVMTTVGSRRKDEHFGTQVSSSLFEGYTIFEALSLQRQIYLAILNEEPRVTSIIPSVQFDPTDRTIRIRVTFTITHTGRTFIFEDILQQTR